MKKEGKHKKNKGKIVGLILLVIFVTVFIVGVCYMGFYIYSKNKDQKDNENILGNIEIDNTKVTPQKTEKMLKLEELQKQNEEIIGWLQIDGTKINYPVCQTTNNKFYVNHNYKKESSELGSLFLDKDFDLKAFRVYVFYIPLPEA